MAHEIQMKCIIFSVTSSPMAQQSTCNGVVKFWELFLSQTHATVWWNEATTASEKCPSRTHYLSIRSKKNLKTKKAVKSALWLK